MYIFLIYYLLYEFIFFLNVQNTIQIRLFMYSKITCLIIIIICLSSCHSLPIYQELWIPRFKEESSIFPVNPNSTRVLFFCVLQILGSLLQLVLVHSFLLKYTLSTQIHPSYFSPLSKLCICLSISDYHKPNSSLSKI